MCFPHSGQYVGYLGLTQHSICPQHGVRNSLNLILSLTAGLLIV